MYFVNNASKTELTFLQKLHDQLSVSASMLVPSLGNAKVSYGIFLATY
jgi:hypothetical protein